MNSDTDSLASLKAIKKQTFNINPQKNLEQAMFEAWHSLQKIVHDQYVTKSTGQFLIWYFFWTLMSYQC